LTRPDPQQRPAERPHPPVAKRDELESTVQSAQLRPPPKRPSGHRAITRPEPKRLPAPRLNRGDTSGPAP
jgi:hypothetical protein